MRSNLAEGGALELVTTSPDREFELVRQAAAGNSHAFKELYNNNVSRIYAVCLRISQNTDTAEELTQEVFIRAWEKLNTFQFESKFSSWLHSIAVNQFLMMKRSEKRFSERISELNEIMNRENPVHKSKHHYDSGIDIERALKKLPQQARMAFVLHDIEGYKHHEVSEMMNIEVGTSKAHLHRARKMLREELMK
ncbi:MAG: RNA polymerase sigma factor [Chlorobi bacterium]|nr:RNA polymerase sigma factor [Chlorobiota bacterium]MCI0716621.1 RNA polymerase sigma factor [Chlorobiota bacterium]